MKQIRISRHKVEKEVLNRKMLFFIYDVVETDDMDGTTIVHAYRIIHTVEIWDMEDLDNMVVQLERFTDEQ